MTIFRACWDMWRALWPESDPAWQCIISPVENYSFWSRNLDRCAGTLGVSTTLRLPSPMPWFNLYPHTLTITGKACAVSTTE